MLGMAPGYAVKGQKKDQMSLLFCLVTFCLFRLYLRPLWSTLMFYYLLLSDYWPSCYMLYKELTLISSSPPLPELKGHFAIQVIHKVGFIEFRYFFFFNIHINAEKYYCEWMKTVFWCFQYLVTFIEVKGDRLSQP